MKAFFRKFREEFRRQTPTFHRAAEKVFGSASLDQAAIEELEEVLYGADFGVETTAEIMDSIREAHRKNAELRGQEARLIGTAVLRRVLEGAEPRASQLPGMADLKRPEVICLVGVNGSGKTTTAAKLGWHFTQEGKSVILGACDTFRAAANEQLKTWSDRLGLELVASHHGADSASVAFDAYAAGVSRSRDLVILDTAGRLHTKSNLMEELRKIRRVLERQDGQAPHHRWIVLDGSLGANSLEQARTFHREFGLTGIIMTKLDGTSRGGALVGIYRELHLPIVFVGLGEAKEDLQPFSVQDYIEALFG